MKCLRFIEIKLYIITRFPTSCSMGDMFLHCFIVKSSSFMSCCNEIFCFILIPLWYNYLGIRKQGGVSHPPEIMVCRSKPLLHYAFSFWYITFLFFNFLSNVSLSPIETKLSTQISSLSFKLFKLNLYHLPSFEAKIYFTFDFSS